MSNTFTETFPSKPILLNEGQDYWFSATHEEIEANKERNNGQIVVSTCMQRKDAVNAMRRLYPGRVLDREFVAFQEKVDKKAGYGERDHPDRSSVNFKESSHTVDHQYWKNSPDGDAEWWGDLTFLPTTVGRDMQSIFESGRRVSISSRGLGSVQRKQDYDEVQDDFVIITFDLVTEPSTFHSNLVLREGVDMGRVMVESPEIYKRYIENKIKLTAEKHKVQDRAWKKRFYDI